jgi:predicted nucleic acid-binding protein
MSRLICVDASFALKLVLDEPDSEQVQALWSAWLAQGVTLIAPCHLAFEVTSVIRNHVYRREISPQAGQLAFEAFLAQEIELRHPGDLEARAWELAQQYNRPTAYDASYLALAESAGCELWTADGRLVRAVGGALPWLKTVRNIARP